MDYSGAWVQTNNLCLTVAMTLPPERSDVYSLLTNLPFVWFFCLQVGRLETPRSVIVGGIFTQPNRPEGGRRRAFVCLLG